MQHRDALDQLARETRRARARLALERALRAGFPAGLGVLAWAAAALFGLVEALPWLAQSLVAGAAVIALALLALRGTRAYRAPSIAEARARLLADSKLAPGAFDALEDRPARYDGVRLAFWRREQALARERAGAAKAGPMRPRLNEIDPLRLRFVAAALCLVALILAGAHGPDRLARAFLPDPGPLLGDQPMAVEAWAQPAPYTRASPVSISDRLGERVETPPSIETTVRVTGPAGAPRLVFQGAGGRREARFSRAADGAWEARLAIPGPGALKIVRFHTRGFWRLAPAPDRAPSVAFTAPLASLPEEHAAFAWQARDDYGVARLALRVRPIDPPPGLAGAAPHDTPIESPIGEPKEGEGAVELDLAAHPYAGMKVEARVVAFDALGQVGESPALRFTLPEKVFLQPLARAAIEIRRHVLTERRAYRPVREARARTLPAGDILMGNQRIGLRDAPREGELHRAPEGVRHASRLIDALTMAPEDGYFRDLAVYLGFALADSQLRIAREIDDTDGAADTLWRTALRAEYGGAADARRALDEAVRALSEAIEEGASPERIRQLMDALRRANEAYMEALRQEAIRNGERDTVEDTQDTIEISQQDIEDVLREVQRLAEQGRTAEAQALLQQLAAVLANMEMRLSQEPGRGGEAGDDEEGMQQSMDSLSRAMGEQRALRDDTERESAEGAGGGREGGAGGGGELAERQARIREALADAQSGAGEEGVAGSDDLSAAERAMRASEEALRRGDLEGARAAQDAALAHMRRGAEELAAAIRAEGREDARAAGRGPRDPLGRIAPGMDSGEGETIVPTEFDPVRAREILDEIRRRAEDPNRPEAEREYLRRLLDRFGGS